MNPYNFVPFGPAAKRTPITTHEKFDGHRGTLTCRLQTLTHFFTAGTQERMARNQHQNLLLLRQGNDPIIPGSSLKGGIRHLVEAISGSCLVLPNDTRMRDRNRDKLEYFDKGSLHSYPSPRDFYPCGLDTYADPKQQSACPACRLFGFLADKVLFAGNVAFTTAHVVGPYQTATLTLEPFGAPSPRHRPFYGTKISNFQEPRGRKFYYHRVEGARTMKDKIDSNKTIEAVLPGAIFEFKVDYENLGNDELALLIYALELEEPMRHKIGMGKGVGLGSVKITIEEWSPLDLSQRYRHLNAGKQTLKGDELIASLKQQREKYHQSYAVWKDSLQALREIWTWDENQKRETQYPSFMWFKDFRTVPLEEVPDDAGQYKVRAASTSPRPAARFEGRSTPSSPRPEQVKAETEAKKRAEKILKQTEREKSSQAHQTAYANNATEPKAQVEQAADGSWLVILPKLPQQKYPLKVRSQFSKAAAGARVRVRVVVDKNGGIVRAEEL